jgi:predicted nucleic acid-binding protein
VTQLVLDTNVVLDLLVFGDPRSQPVSAGLAGGTLHWLATAAMREELARVLRYPKLAERVDQKFIDLAVAHRCLLLSKDHEVLRMRKRLARLQVTASDSLSA